MPYSYPDNVPTLICLIAGSFIKPFFIKRINQTGKTYTNILAFN